MNTNTLTIKKKQLDAYRPLPPALVSNLESWFTIELTYTSNALEGNTLTRKETAAVVEKGLTVGGKSLKEHLEATNHAKAIDKIYSLVVKHHEKITENDILDIHNTILRGIDDENAGHYRSVSVRISGSEVILPNPAKVPDLMEEFVAWLGGAGGELHPTELAAEAHYRLVTIHPFVDGNGRTARLLMNLILMQHGYPPALIRMRDRIKYISGLEKAQLGGPKDDYSKIIFDAIDRSLDIYLKAMTGEEQGAVNPMSTSTQQPLLKIGQLAKRAGESIATIRFWTKEGLLDIAEVTSTRYHMYSPKMIQRIEQIRKLQQKRLTLREIKEKIEESRG